MIPVLFDIGPFTMLSILFVSIAWIVTTGIKESTKRKVRTITTEETTTFDTEESE